MDLKEDPRFKTELKPKEGISVTPVVDPLLIPKPIESIEPKPFLNSIPRIIRIPATIAATFAAYIFIPLFLITPAAVMVTAFFKDEYLDLFK